MKFTFTGTGTSQGIPVIACPCEICNSPDPRDKRLRTSGVLQSDTTTLVFDTGPDFRQQMLRHEIKVLDAVVFTHQHKDHVAGLDDVRAYNYLLDRKMDIYANQLTLDHLKKEFYYIFADLKYPGIPQIETHLIDKEPFRIGDIELLPIPVLHYKLPVLGFRVQNFAYVTDANFISPESMALLEGVEILVLNALRKNKHLSHFTLDEAVAVSRELGVKQAYFTHLSHLMGTHATVSRELPDWVSLAYDGLSIDF